MGNLRASSEGGRWGTHSLGLQGLRVLVRAIVLVNHILQVSLGPLAGHRTQHVSGIRLARVSLHCWLWWTSGHQDYELHKSWIYGQFGGGHDHAFEYLMWATQSESE